MTHIKSIFEQISTQVFQMTDVVEAKTFITSFLEQKSIKEEDKKQILRNLQQIKNISRLHTYLCNSLLKYEGLGVAI